MPNQPQTRIRIVRTERDYLMAALTADGKKLYALIAEDRALIQRLRSALRVWVILALVGWGILGYRAIAEWWSP